MTDKKLGHTLAYQLALWCINDAQLYRSMAKSIIYNYAVKMVKGIYDPKKAIVGWVNLVEEGLRTFRTKNTKYLYTRVDKETKVTAARIIEEYYKNELEEKALQLYDLKKKGKAWQRRPD